jgi:hypothetical protein
MKFGILFESKNSNDCVGVMEESSLIRGPIASQNAGSTNQTIYYQVGGSGVNGFFATALGRD